MAAIRDSKDIEARLTRLEINQEMMKKEAERTRGAITLKMLIAFCAGIPAAIMGIKYLIQGFLK